MKDLSKISNGVNKKISTSVAIVIILICAVLVGGLAVWQYFGVPKIEISEFKPTEKTPPAAETANWRTYQNEEYGFEFKYPQGWIFEDQPTGGTYDFLDIHLSNFQHSDSPVCDPNFIGLEIQVGLPKDQNQNFSSFVKSQIVESGLGPKGSLEEIKVDNHLGFKVQYSGWDSGCSGPGYFIEQDKNHYIYIFTGAHKDNWGEGLDLFNKILSTFRFLE